VARAVTGWIPGLAAQPVAPAAEATVKN
jgi:hypothetical protein